MEKGIVYWITGLSGAGKTTVGKKLYKNILERKPNVVFLDGDNLREVMASKIGYDSDSRKELSFKYSNICAMLSNQGIDVVCCAMAMFDACRDMNRKNIENYREIYLKVPVSELRMRDPKKIYERAFKNEIKNVMGVDIDFEAPKTPDIVIENYGDISASEAVNLILQMFNGGENYENGLEKKV